jgi:membrane protein YdbS with pleckstrin-like domain
LSFSNEPLDLESLPRFEDVAYQRTSARYPGVALGTSLALLLPAFLAAVAVLVFIAPLRTALIQTPLGLIAVAAICAFVFLPWFAYKSASVIRFAVRQRDVIVKKGIFWKKETIQPIKRIQHVEQSQGPVDKRFGLHKLKLYSAGTGHMSFEIPGLEEATAERIKAFILQSRQEAGTGDTANDANAPPLAAKAAVTAAEPHKKSGEEHADDR